jgi:hypothetical protein
MQAGSSVPFTSCMRLCSLRLLKTNIKLCFFFMQRYSHPEKYNDQKRQNTMILQVRIKYQIEHACQNFTI